MSFVLKDDFELVTASATTDRRFPVLSIKNGQQNPVLVSVRNGADGFVDLVSVKASFHDPRKGWKLIRETPPTTFADSYLPPNSSLTLPYSFYSDFPPSLPLGLTLSLSLLTHNIAPKTPHRLIAWNGTVSVIEPPPTPGFDVGLWFLYAILLGSMLFAGWSSWGVLRGKVLGQGGDKKGKGVAKGEGKGKKIKVVVPATSGKPYPESAKPYEEEWIPEGLVKKRGLKAAREKLLVGEAREAVAEATSGRVYAGGDGEGVRKR